MQQPHLTSTDLQQFIDQRQITATILHLAEDTPTVPDAARALGVQPEQIVKTLVFIINDAPVLVIANGVQKIDQGKLAAHLGVGKKQVKFASAKQALEMTGYIVGSMPPFGHKTPLPAYLEPQIMALDSVYAGGGDIHAMLNLTPAVLLQASGAELLPVVAD